MIVLTILVETNVLPAGMFRTVSISIESSWDHYQRSHKGKIEYSDILNRHLRCHNIIIIQTPDPFLVSFLLVASTFMHHAKTLMISLGALDAAL